MSRGPVHGTGTIGGPDLLPCGAYVSQREKRARCQKCYGRKSCVCARGTIMPCEGGFHMTPGSRNAHPVGRAQRGFVDLGHNRRGFGSAR